ncbi:hypothetical protein RclHR1_02800005 [Rhizophagus clarus]|uniref:Uncharacterized protein n=1 Tax=Rhizophagus clarus TaxID=94130 RepID=A0A2Z6R3R4_9GLOM|nr:hypothetical protein RclHR1_02800005 [Rhizophagus clarus]
MSGQRNTRRNTQKPSKKTASPMNSKSNTSTLTTGSLDNNQNTEIFSDNESTALHDQQGIHTQTPEPTSKEKNKIINTNQDTLMHEQLDLTGFSGEQNFLSFCPLTHFPNSNNPHEVQNTICAYFAQQSSFKGCRLDTICNISIIVLTFNSEVDRKAINNMHIGVLKVIFYDFTQENTTKIIKIELEKIFNRSIRFVDIPVSYLNEILIGTIQNQFGKVHSYKEIIKPKYSNKNKRQTKPNIYKQLHVVFTDSESVSNIYQKGIFSMKIENWIYRILSTDLNHPEHHKRTNLGIK